MASQKEMCGLIKDVGPHGIKFQKDFFLERGVIVFMTGDTTGVLLFMVFSTSGQLFLGLAAVMRIASGDLLWSGDAEAGLLSWELVDLGVLVQVRCRVSATFVRRIVLGMRRLSVF